MAGNGPPRRRWPLVGRGSARFAGGSAQEKGAKTWEASESIRESGVCGLRDRFFARQGEFSQAGCRPARKIDAVWRKIWPQDVCALFADRLLVHFKEKQRRAAGKDPSGRAGRLWL